MPKFKYVANAPDGAEVKGIIQAETLGGAGLALLEKDLQVSSLKEHRSILQYEISRKKVHRQDLMHFSRQMAVFLRAGIPVLDALQVMQSETNKKVMAACLQGMIESLHSGGTFTAAATAQPEMFPPFYLGVLEAAELTGNLDNALDELAEYIDRDLEAKRKIHSAMFYPAIVLVMSIGVVGILTGYVLPKFKTFFEELDAELPLPTRMMLGIGDIFVTFWPLIIGGMLALSFGLAYALRTPRGKDIRDRVILRVPVLGDLVKGAIIERFCRTLSSMVRAGVSLPDAISVTSTGTNNSVYKRGLNDVREAMLQGRGLAEPISESGLFPGAARQMIRVGEETGTLDKQLETSAKYFERDLDFKITRFTNLFEPAVIIFMGLIVGFVAIAMISAMYGIFNQVEIT